MTNSLTRRRFLGQTAMATAAVWVAGRQSSFGQGSANDKLNIGFIGVGNRAGADLHDTAKVVESVNVAALCDVDEVFLAKAKQEFPSAKTYHDFRRLLEQKDLDAVVIGTPDHTHAVAAAAALKSGRHVYCEKPLTRTVSETRALTKLAQQRKLATQLGTQIHASENYRRIVEYLRSGNLGPVGKVRTFNVMNQGVQGVGTSAEPAPEGLDWDFWCGPAPLIPFNSILFSGSYNHGSWMDYSGGWTPGMAPHIVDLPVWALDLKFPTEVSSSGGRFIIKDDGDAYDQHEALWKYPNMTMTWMSSRFAGRSTMDWLTMSVPPGASTSSYLSNDGRLRATASGGFLTSGEPISWSAMTTVQFAVPPRISGP